MGYDFRDPMKEALQNYEAIERTLKNYRPASELIIEEMMHREKTLDDLANQPGVFIDTILMSGSELMKEIMARADVGLLESFKSPFQDEVIIDSFLMHPSWMDEIKKSQVDFNTLAKEVIAESSSALTAARYEFSNVNFESLRDLAGDQMALYNSFEASYINLTRDLGLLANSITDATDISELPIHIIPLASKEILLTGRVINAIVDKSGNADIPEHETKVNETADEYPSLSNLLELKFPKLQVLYIGAIKALRGNNPDRKRHTLASLRELSTHILQALAPDEAILNWMPTNDPNLLRNGRKKRTVQIKYILRDIDNGEIASFLEADVQSYIKLFSLLNRLHEIDPNFSDQQMEAITHKVSNFLSFILRFHVRN